MRLLSDLCPASPSRGLAVDEALLDAVRHGAPDAVRLWVSDCSLILGRSQALAAEVARDRARELGIPILRRISGGGTVYHYPGNVNLSIVTGSKRRMGSVEETFRQYGSVLAEALQGIAGDVAVRGNGLFIGERKVAGAAQARRGGGCLFHSTLMVTPPALAMEQLLRAHRSDYAPLGTPSRPHPMTSLTEAAGATITIEQVAGRIVDGLVRIFPDLCPGRLSESEERDARTLEVSKYENRTWNASR